MIRVLDRAVQILEAVAGTEGTTLATISRAVDLPNNTTLRILQALAKHGFVEQDRQCKTYSLGRKLLSLSLKVSYPPSLVAVASVYMQEFSQQTGEDIGLAVLEGVRAHIIHTVMGPEPLKIITNLHANISLSNGAFRKVLLAYQSPEWVKSYLDSTELVQYTDTTIVDKAAIESELREIRMKGVAYSRGEFLKDAAGIAVPLFGIYDEFLGSLFIVGPDIRLTEKRLITLQEKLCCTADMIMASICGNAI